MLWLKGCPKCGGDLQDADDKFGPYIACIQCGFNASELEMRWLRSDARTRTARAPAPHVPAGMAR
jgi:hypothetical protein